MKIIKQKKNKKKNCLDEERKKEKLHIFTDYL